MSVKARIDFSNFGSLKSTETYTITYDHLLALSDFSNFGSLKSTETFPIRALRRVYERFQQFRLVEEH